MWIAKNYKWLKGQISSSKTQMREQENSWCKVFGCPYIYKQKTIKKCLNETKK